ncbi:MAG TPA: hypothetical protein VJ761_21955 [Ktedonobacteraceae bacterium]|nr:hypothetical protein [Ktedonobacteraceae bacterium]
MAMNLVFVATGGGEEMTDRRGIDNRLVGEEEGMGEAERLQDALAHGDLVGLTRHDFDDASRQQEAGTTVGPEFTGCRHLAQGREAGNAAGEGVITHAEVVVVIAQQAALVAQEMAQRDAVTGALVGELQIGQVGDNRSVEVERALLSQGHDEGRGVDLADGADQEECVGAHRVAGFEARDAVGAGFAFAAVQHANGDAGDSPAGHLLADVRIQVCSYLHLAFLSALWLP